MLRHLTYGMVNCEKLMGKTFAFFYFIKIHIEGDIHVSLTVTKSLQKCQEASVLGLSYLCCVDSDSASICNLWHSSTALVMA